MRNPSDLSFTNNYFNQNHEKSAFSEYGTALLSGECTGANPGV